ncbi:MULTISPECIES: nucleotidyltransferase domain-containing protein [Actinosynnema]|uniref:nucleotidyltransferase domain-containing protein n=1 Tax=Actinosynnema TaxID=40566 RepID=UPI0020A50CBD|nr:aminoglycoside nucleotidyltransferase [Actinosynnema pretiosum]MCP2099102.1 2''-aminoglycoside nucleotidyltransferase [Actinosynnema pretiosum]
MVTSTPEGAVTGVADVLAVLDLAEAAGARLRVDGGWGVDALLGEQTRPHGDLDVVVEKRFLGAFLGALEGAGFARVGEPGAVAWNFLVARGGVVVDLHVVELDAEGRGVLGPAERGVAYPAGSLRGRGVVGGREVDCVAAEWAVRFHDQYTGDADDRADVRALCARFDPNGERCGPRAKSEPVESHCGAAVRHFVVSHCCAAREQYR